VPDLLTYGDHPAQVAELTRPDGPSRGVVVVVHGGFWRARHDCSLGRPLATDLAGRGWTALNLEYRRVGDGGGVPQTLDDVAAGIDLLRRADVDTATVVTLGHSAGGHLATWAATRMRHPRWAGGVDVTHVVAQAGVLDLERAARDRLGDGAVQALTGGGPDEVPEAYALADPARQVPHEQPVWCVHARDDQAVPFAQSEDYVAAATAAGAEAALVEVSGGHFDVIDPRTEAWARVVGVLDALGAS
jgi:acetyl esterase/lipase